MYLAIRKTNTNLHRAFSCFPLSLLQLHLPVYKSIKNNFNSESSTILPLLSKIHKMRCSLTRGDYFTFIKKHKQQMW
ncbi:hypothetical protein QQG55_22775 [Brugia pahangi]